MTTTSTNEEIAEAALFGVSEHLALIVDRELTLEDVRVETADSRPAGEGVVHISFRLTFTREEVALSHGSILLPLPDAISLAAYLLTATDAEVKERRELVELDRSTKEALLEVGNFMAGAVGTVVREQTESGLDVRSAGCQGVRAGVRPAFPYEEGTELIVARAKARLHDWPEFELIAILPIFDNAAG